MQGKNVKNTTKFAPPEEGEYWVSTSPIVKKINPKEEIESKKLALKLYLEKNHFTKTYSFINSIAGQLHFFSKLEVENEMKDHCLNTCFTEDSHLTKNLTQFEKNCLTNCAIETNVLLEGFRMYNHFKLLRGQKYQDYEVDKSISINRI